MTTSKAQTLGDAMIDAVRQMDAGASPAEVCVALDKIVERTPADVVKKGVRAFLAGMVEGWRESRP